jgi:hypothetical protein
VSLPALNGSAMPDFSLATLSVHTLKGLSTFIAHIRGSCSVGAGTISNKLNGDLIRRLEPKMSVIPVRYAEFVLHGTRVWLFSTERAGVREIATALNVTEHILALGELHHWGRVSTITRAFACVQIVDGAKFLKHSD